MKSIKGKGLAELEPHPIFHEEPLVVACIKVRYASEAEASAKLLRGFRPYRCRLCSGWHLTKSGMRDRRHRSGVG